MPKKDKSPYSVITLQRLLLMSYISAAEQGTTYKVSDFLIFAENDPNYKTQKAVTYDNVARNVKSLKESGFLLSDGRGNATVYMLPSDEEIIKFIGKALNFGRSIGFKNYAAPKWRVADAVEALTMEEDSCSTAAVMGFTGLGDSQTLAQLNALTDLGFLDKRRGGKEFFWRLKTLE